MWCIGSGIACSPGAYTRRAAELFNVDMFGKGRHRHERSSIAPTDAPPPVSPLHVASSPRSTTPQSPYIPSDDSLRRKTSDGLGIAGNRKSIVSLQPPVLPPIPRVASRYESSERAGLPETKQSRAFGETRNDSDNISSPSTNSRKSQGLSPHLGFEKQPPIDLVPVSRTISAASADMSLSSLSPPLSPSPRMESSLFPNAASSPVLPPIHSGLPMSRAFIDSRDKPYSKPAHRPVPIQTSISSPLMPTLQSEPLYPSSHYSSQPMSPVSFAPSSATSLRVPKISGTRLSPNSSVEDLRAQTQRTQSTASGDYIGTAASYHNGSVVRPSTYASVSPSLSARPPARSPLQSSTIGTPYQATSPLYPLPQHVATRPKTVGSTSSVAGVSVPTHHTSAARADPAKTEKRKTRSLNPMSLLIRRRSGPSGDTVIAERSAAAQAYERQKSVATVGVRNLPEDFDPTIRGKVVHDFSAPRPSPRHNLSYNDADAFSPSLPSAGSGMSVPSVQEDLVRGQPSATPSKPPSDVTNTRRSVHSPIFKELLTEDPDAANRVSSLNAERLENKQFLQRVSHHSSVSTFSQESAVLPPFARRSQTLDPVQVACLRDDDSRRGSDPSSAKDGGSNVSSTHSESPATTRSSDLNVDPHYSMSLSLSPVSPPSQGKGGRPMCDLLGKPAFASPEARGNVQAEFIARPYSIVLAPPAIDTTAEHHPESPPLQRSPKRDSSLAPEAVVVPHFESTLAPESAHRMYLPMPEHSSSLVTPELTPEIAVADSIAAPKAPKSPPKVVEKRASAVGHAKRASLTPKHHVSNASRFSFQFGDSAAEEQALEAKHRKIVSSGDVTAPGARRHVSPDEDEDDFDEDAMDDMDEFEVQELEIEPHGLSEPNGAELSEGSVYEDDDEQVDGVTNPEYPAFRAQSARTLDNASRRADGWAGRTLDSSAAARQTPEPQQNHRPDVGDAGDADFLEDNFSSHDSMPGGAGGARPRSGFYTQPKAAGYSPTASPHREKPPLPHRDGGNSERNRAASGLSFGFNEALKKHQSTMSSSTSDQHDPRRIMSQPTLGSKTIPAGLGLGGLGDLDFGDTPDLTISDSRPTSFHNNVNPNINRRTKDSETIPADAAWPSLEQWPSRETPPSQLNNRKSYFSSSSPSSDSAAYRGHIGQSIRARHASMNQNLQYAPSDSEDDADHDDIYFDGGGFEEDIQNPDHDRHESINEDAFDDDAFLRRRSHVTSPPLDHPRAISAMSLRSDGPYPSFAMGANPVKARQRQSQLLLEDLPLIGPVDPKLIPQRNPSEDAKRLGLSSRVPPLPPQAGSKEAAMRMQANLQSYHATLADALNQAAAEGRFARQPSISTVRSTSVYSNAENDDNTIGMLSDDRSQYSRDEPSQQGALQQRPIVEEGLSRSISQETSGSRIEQSQTYSPPKMSFDFGFDTLPTDVEDNGVSDDYGNDDDIVAAANAEVLASDDDGFYGHEFGFYAHARPNSGVMQAVNGGYFGPDGDDGLARNKSLQEPNLTPITERSEFSTRNSFIGLGAAHGHGAAFGAGTFGPASPALARLPTSPLADGGAGATTSFDQLRKLRANAFGGSNGSLASEGKGLGIFAWQKAAAAHSPSLSARSPTPSGQGYFGHMNFAHQGPGSGPGPGPESGSTPSSGRDSTPSSGHPMAHRFPHQYHPHHDSPQTASSAHMTPIDPDVTPRRGPNVVQPSSPPVPVTARKAPPFPSGPAPANRPTYARKGSDLVAYVREAGADMVAGGKGQPRWVLERRRTSEQGAVEVVGREVVQGGWI